MRRQPRIADGPRLPKVHGGDRDAGLTGDGRRRLPRVLGSRRDTTSTDDRRALVRLIRALP
ncbi:hypothetical protein [Streptomyces sp. NPDC053069]|uniref:hypothetical protein n=1 Tax=Streptomyces sp. NPDC053069 TaxID=3365695 RepID=UPI0037D83089